MFNLSLKRVFERSEPDALAPGLRIFFPSGSCLGLLLYVGRTD